jgi:hypothetical protein
MLESTSKKSDSSLVKGGAVRKSKPLKLGQKKDLFDFE